MQQYDLTSSQKNIDELQRFYEVTSISVLCGAVIFDELLESEKLMRAAESTIRSHEALRLRFCTVGGKTKQYLSDEVGEVSFRKFSSRDDMRKFCRGQARIPFENDGSQMFRMTVFELPDCSGVILCASHLISDAWTYSILANEIYNTYHQQNSGGNADREIFGYTKCIGKSIGYLSSQKYISDCKYWAEKYSGGVEETPVRICRKVNAGAAAERYVTAFSEKLSRAANDFCAENGISMSVLFESAVLLYLSKINKENRSVTVGVPVLGRSGAKEKLTAGMFISTLPLTLAPDPNESALSLCQKTAAAHMGIYRRRMLPYSDILRGARENHGFSGRLFDVMVNCQNAQTGVPAKTEWFSNGYCEVPAAFHLDDRDGPDRYILTVDYQTDVFSDREEIRLLAKRIMHIVSQITADKSAPLKDISILPADEYELLINGFNATAADYPKDKCVHELFSEIAAKFPDRSAVVFGQKKYTYRQLDKMSDTLARFIRSKGIGKNDIVPIIAHRSPYIIAAMLGVMKAGAAYMPVSPDFPKQRVEYMIKNTGAKLALTCGCRFGIIEEIALERFDYTSAPPARKFGICGSSDDLCYVIFTSGSTGNPKGTAITHRNVMNYCAANRFNVAGKIIKNRSAGILSVTDIVFDIFVTESLLPLLNGMTICLADDEQAASQRALGKLVLQSGAQIIQTTPTKMRSFLFDKNCCGYLSSLSKIILGGEEFSADLCRELKKFTDAEIYNIYGPAETTVWSALTLADDNDITIGRPVANTRIYILDSERQPVPAGIMGEIYISGDGVGRGYINNPELTVEKFLPDPFCGGYTMYKTGDLGLIRADGCIEFLGRSDFQIKLRGLRIELGEIENAICSFEGVKHAAAVCRKDGKGEKYLAGFYTCEGDIDERALRRHILSRLPSYMIPNVFVRLAEMPMTQSGKICRNALPETDISAAVCERNYTAPVSETEKTLCEILAKVLGVPRVGTEDDFFELGGDSFSAMEFAAAAEEKGLYFSARSIYLHSTVKKLSRVISRKKSAKDTRKKYSRYPMKRTDQDIKVFDLFVRLTRHIYTIKISGLDSLDLSEKFIFCPNHESDLDCMWVLSALSEHIDINDCCALIAAEHLDLPLPRRIFRITGGIPIERKGDFVPSLDRAVSVLKKKKRFLIIHPEGTRTRSGRLGKFKKGAALIAKRTGVRAVPVYIDGAREIYPVCKKFPRLFNAARMKKYPLRIFFGKPIDPAGKTADQLTAEIRRQIVDMKNGEKL